MPDKVVMVKPASHSLRRRLLGLVMTAIALAALFQALSAYRSALRQADTMSDYHLQQMAFALRGGPPLAVPLLEGDEAAGVDYSIQIWGADGVRLFQSRRIALPARAVLGFSDLTHEGVRYRVYSLQNGHRMIQIAQDMDEREARARALAAGAVLPIAAIAPLLMLALWWVIRRSLDPLERTRQQVARRAVQDLAPLSEGGLPDEVRPLVQEINLLFGRLQTAFDAQTTFVANAAHELRSPLTALRLQAQLLERSGSGPQREQAVARLHEGIERSIRLMHQLLLLARHEGQAPHDALHQEVELGDLMRAAVGEVLGQARERGIDIGVLPSASATVDGDPDALRSMLRNLLENAINYTPQGGRVDVQVRLETGAPLLSVEDSGPGIAPAQRERVFERFVRGAEAQGSGSGLGLAIAQTIARAHQARITLGHSSTLGGLSVSVRFGSGLRPA